MGTPKESETLLIGKDIPWESIEKEDLRVIHFAPLAEVRDSKIKGPLGLLPYGLLTVESPLIPREATLPVTHKVDFHNLWDIFKVRGVNPDEEVLVFYAPSSGFLSRIKPKLHIFIYPKGHQEEIHNPDFKTKDPQSWFKPIAEWRPR